MIVGLLVGGCIAAGYVGHWSRMGPAQTVFVLVDSIDLDPLYISLSSNFDNRVMIPGSFLFSWQLCSCPSVLAPFLILFICILFLPQ